MPVLKLADTINKASILDGKLLFDDSGIGTAYKKWHMMDYITNMYLTDQDYLFVKVNGTPHHPAVIEGTRTNVWLTEDGAICIKRPPPSAGALKKVWYWFSNLYVDGRCLIPGDVLPRLYIFFKETNTTGMVGVSEIFCAIWQEDGSTILTEDGLCYLVQD
jgi:hypothetical protein